MDEDEFPEDKVEVAYSLRCRFAIRPQAEEDKSFQVRTRKVLQFG